MFEDEMKRFMTDRICAEISHEIINHLFWMIDELRKTSDELSHIQIFKLKGGKERKDQQDIIHQQLNLPYYEESTVHMFEDDPVKNSIIWAVDTGEYQTLLFPEEMY
ncbi:DUF960 family protein [Sporosarcina sp. FA9]|uniref:DUF960 family protein n=1 Tax=Sporosarcina sp. FA9 TaxID=3413030 RepID=UPI003F654D74